MKSKDVTLLVGCGPLQRVVPVAPGYDIARGPGMSHRVWGAGLALGIGQDRYFNGNWKSAQKTFNIIWRRPPVYLGLLIF